MEVVSSGSTINAESFVERGECEDCAGIQQLFVFAVIDIIFPDDTRRLQDKIDDLLIGPPSAADQNQFRLRSHILRQRGKGLNQSLLIFPRTEGCCAENKI